MVKSVDIGLDLIPEIAENGCYDEYGMPLDELSIILQKIREYKGVYNEKIR